MRDSFTSIRDYHERALGAQAERLDLPGFALTRLEEPSGDVSFARTALHAVVLTLDGTVRHLTRMDGIDDPAPSRPGEVSLMPAGIAARLAWTNRGPVQRSLLAEFDLGLLRGYAPEFVTGAVEAGHLCPAGYAERPAVAALIRLAARELEPESRRGRLFAESLARLLAIEIVTSAWTARAPAPPAASRRRDSRIHRAIDFIEAHLARDIGLVEIAAAAALSPSQLTALFRREVGRTPYAHVLHRRLERAARMLRDTDAPIAAIAQDCGFADQQHMTRAFRTRLATTPGAVRREHGSARQR